MTDTAVLGDYLEAAQEAARRGAAVLEHWRKRFSVREKARFDLVTDADLASQKAIYEYLGNRYPAHRFLGEEDKTPQARPGPDAPPTWIVDPLDGTTNYVHDFPLYCVSIGLQVAGELVVAYGTRELPELCRQSIDYAQAWVERGLAGHLLPIDGADHFTILEALARPGGALLQGLIDMTNG